MKEIVYDSEDRLGSIKQFLNAFLELDLRVNKGQGGGIIDYYKLLLEKGMEFHGRNLVKKYPAAQSWVKHFKPQPKQCFYNSQMFVISSDVGRYFEGYAYENLIPFHHGWVVMDDDKVIDFTLEACERSFRRDKRSKREPNGVAYLGVEVPKEALRRLVLKYESAEPYAHMHYLGTRQRFF